MQEIFIALIFIFDVQSGQPIEAGTAAFVEREVCEVMVDRIKENAAADLTIYVEAECVSAPLIGAR